MTLPCLANIFIRLYCVVFVSYTGVNFRVGTTKGFTHLKFVDQDVFHIRYDSRLFAQKAESIHQEIVKVETSKLFQCLLVLLI